MKKILIGLFCIIGVLTTIFSFLVIIITPVTQYNFFHENNDW